VINYFYYDVHVGVSGKYTHLSEKLLPYVHGHKWNFWDANFCFKLFIRILAKDRSHVALVNLKLNVNHIPYHL